MRASAASHCETVRPGYTPNVPEWVGDWVGDWVGEWVGEWVSESSPFPALFGEDMHRVSRPPRDQNCLETGPRFGERGGRPSWCARTHDALIPTDPHRTLSTQAPC